MVEINKLKNIVNWIGDSNANAYYLLLNVFMLSDIFVLYNLEKWRRKNGFKIRTCIKTIAEFEALISISNIAFDNPKWSYPDFAEERSIECRGIAHPLLGEKAESNDFASTESDDNKPNVIFIMSESFSDFRVFNSLNISDDIYSGFDEVAKEGFMGHCIVPTFGGYTTRTEFELLTGLPTYAINTPSVPQNLLKKQDIIDSFPRYFKNLGYSTTYIHPFSKTFYDRETLYPEYSFDNLYFDDNMTVKSNNFRRYISDESVFNQIKSTLQSNNGPNYIFTTTMQNHQPYYEKTSEDSDQLTYYLNGIKETSNQLREFTNWLKNFDKEVILVFVGDHFPFFTPDDDVYGKLDVSDSNSNLIYTQKYIIWNNYDSSILNIEDKTISAFYIPYILTDIINSKDTKFTSAMKSIMNDYPLYSPSIQSSKNRNDKLDLITYDRVIGKNYSNEIETNTN